MSDEKSYRVGRYTAEEVKQPGQPLSVWLIKGDGEPIGVIQTGIASGYAIHAFYLADAMLADDEAAQDQALQLLEDFKASIP